MKARCFLVIVTYLAAFWTLTSCGSAKKEEDDPEAKTVSNQDIVPGTPPVSVPVLAPVSNRDPEPEPEPVPEPVQEPAPTPSPTETPPAPIQFWTASNSLKVVAGYSYSTTGIVSHISTIDLTAYIPAGAITSLTFLSKDILLATVDPGAAGEKIVRIDLDGETAKSINSSWYQDATNLNNVILYRLVKWSSSKLVALRSGTSAEGISYDLDSNIAFRSGSSALIKTTVGSCTVQNFQVGMLVTSASTKKLLTATSGAAPRLMLYDGIDSSVTCVQSYNPTTELGITTAHVQTGMAQMPDGKIYVRFQHTTAPLIARYDFNGTALSTAVSVLNDTASLNITTTDRELVALDSSHLLFANWATDAIYKFDTTTGAASPIVRNFLSIDINAIAVRPAR